LCFHFKNNKMAHFELLMPKMGESVEEATITKWFVKVGDVIEDDDVLLEIATDKVDSEIPSPVSGTVARIMFKQDETVPVGTVIALIDTSGEAPVDKEDEPGEIIEEKPEEVKSEGEQPLPEKKPVPSADDQPAKSPGSGKFYSPLVLKIAREEGISMKELDSIPGSGRNGRVQKKDVLEYIEGRTKTGKPPEPAVSAPADKTVGAPVTTPEKPKVSVSVSAEDEIIEMDRMRKLIAEHMVMSKKVSPHVTNMVEADVTNVVLWRNRIKDEFFRREQEKITYLPVFLEAAIKAIKDYPMINGSVDGDKIIIRKNINIGIAVALPTGNLIVPVIKQADQLNLLGITKSLNELADRARNNKLSPDDIQGGTFSVSNFGTFRNIMGTPIINQPQVAILAVGTVEKKPAVIETPTGDVIGIRYKMFLSLTYDHRIIDGAYGGAFLRKLADCIEDFDTNRSI
jgi:2-oxoglutarate dehydrogenase E2 component (dihydrolipoamide succinyltransferase)